MNSITKNPTTQKNPAKPFALPRATLVKIWGVSLFLSITALLLCQTPAYAAITYFASASNPQDNDSYGQTTVDVTPPGSMQTGDLVVMVGLAREPDMELAISDTGGQAWTAETANTTTSSQRIFWARYNGTWSANPSVSFPSNANATTVVMHVFRPTSSSSTWAVDVALTNVNYSAPSGDNDDVTISGITTVTNGAVVFASWMSRDDNTWLLQTGGWTNAGSAQYRNRDGSDVSQSTAYKIMPTAGASGNVTNRQETRGGDAGNTSILAFQEVVSSPMYCFTDDFTRSDLSSDWNPTHSNGSFGDPQIINNRLRLTDSSTNVATAAHLQKRFPGASNKIIVEFDHFAYGGNGADGIGVALSDATITPQAGAYGGSLGYAQRTGVNGFAGGWLGVGIDEYGNFANPTEGRSGGSGFTVDSVTTRGSGSGTTGYAFHATSGTLSPGIDQTPAAGYRYRVTIDHSNDTNAYVTVERNTGSGYTTVVPQYDAKTKSGQAAVPTHWMLSYTGSTGASTNIHEIDNLSVCTTQPILSMGGLHHVRLNHTGSGVVCAGEQVTVYACSDADANGACTANTGGVTGNVLAKSSGGATLVTVPFTIASGSSWTVVTVPVTSAQTVTFETSGLSATPVASPGWTCWNGSTASCSNTYTNAGFIFASTTGGAETTIPTQVASVSSGTYYLRAVKTNTATHACEAALTGANTVNFAYECNDPTSCYSSNLMSLNGGTATTIARNNNGSVSSYTSVNMTFDATGNAPFTYSYGDVGKVKLYASKTASGSLLSTLTGSSNSFSVKPYDFLVIPCATLVSGACTTAPADPGLIGGGSAFVKSGASFNATLTARTATATATPSFGLGSNNTTETVNLTHARLAPFGSGTADGNLSGTTAIPRNIFINGIATINNLSWSEVGVISLTATNSTFLGSATTTTGTSGNIGRFIPDHFAITPGVVTEGCDSGNFTYFGQDGFATPFTLTAQNAANGTTQNYTGNFAKLDLTLWNNYIFTATWLPAAPNPISTLLASATAPTGSWSNGIASVTPIHQASRPASPVAAANITINAKPTDTDGVTIASATPVQTAVTPLRYGRLVLKNAYGTEREALKMRLQSQYYNGSAFITNADDTCVSFSATALACTDANAADTLICTDVTASGTNISNGQYFTLSAPNKTGPLLYTLTVDSWLKYEWDNADNDYNENPAARANFGIYRGNDRILNWREIIR